jgi:Ca2+-binding RTX toxin-like protein
MLSAGGSGQNHLDGGAGEDSLGGGGGADVLVGGTGGDGMGGGGGDDVYILRAGDGGAGILGDNEQIFEGRNGGVDTIHLEDLTPADVKLMMSPLSGGTLRLEMKAPDGSASYVDFRGGEVTPTSHSAEIELITFADGTVWDLREGLPPLDDYAPIARNDIYTVEAGETIVVDAAHGVLANDSDPDGDPLTLIWSNGPSDGTMVKNADGSFQYTPEAGFTGEDNALYRIEANGLIDSGQIAFIVTPPEPDAPVATDDSGFTTAAETPLTIAAVDLLANDTDADGDALSITAVSDAVGGTAALDASGNPVFTPDAGFSGPASFRYTVSDGGLTATAQVQLTVEEGGNSDDDILSGGSGDDTLDGGAGEDGLSGGNGADRLLGGSGNDTLNGGNGKDVMEGGIGNDALTAGNDADRLAGGAGDDVLSGGNGDDRLDGEDGADSLSGGNGADRIEGGAGADILTGGNGGDLFIFKAGFGSDVITDLRLSGASRDRIAFEDGIFDSMADMLSHAADTAGGVLIATDAADALLIRETTAAQLAANPEDFFFS